MENIESRVNPIIHAAAFNVDETEAKRLCEETQKLWDSGHSFVRENAAALMLAQLGGLDRRADSQEELDAAVSQLETKLAWLAIHKTVSQMSREECAAFVHTMGCLDTSAKVNVLGQEFHYSDLCYIWNNTHPHDRPVYLKPSFEN